MQEKLTSCEFYVEGMHCAACEILIEDELSKFTGVAKVEARLADQRVVIHSETAPTPQALTALVSEFGYRIVSQPASPKLNWSQLAQAAGIAIAIALAFLLLQKLDLIRIIGDGEPTLPVVFLIGVLASLSTCMAVVGGLVLSLSSNYARGAQLQPMVAFHAARLIGFFILGGVMGIIGTAFTLTSASTFALDVVLFVVMILMGLNLLDVFAFTRRWQLRMPKLAGRAVQNLQQHSSILMPVMLGVATFILPCGFTQSMQLFALASGNFIHGAIIMFVFALGTFPALALISFASNKFAHTLRSGLFYKTAGLLVIFFAVFNFAAALVAVGVLPPFLNL